jgi:predicted nuclease of predicted toxin-antitoxin system
MRVLIDECVPKRFKRLLHGHSVHTVQEMGWSAKKNGVLLQLMTSQNFDVLLTVDKNLPKQQLVKGAAIAIILLRAKSNRIGELAPLAPAVLAALGVLQPGEFLEIH